MKAKPTPAGRVPSVRRPHEMKHFSDFPPQNWTKLWRWMVYFGLVCGLYRECPGVLPLHRARAEQADPSAGGRRRGRSEGGARFPQVSGSRASLFGVLLLLISCVLRFSLVALFGFWGETAFRYMFGLGCELIYVQFSRDSKAKSSWILGFGVSRSGPLKCMRSWRDVLWAHLHDYIKQQKNPFPE